MGLIKRQKKKRNRSEWQNMTISELQQRMAHRLARIEVLKFEIEELKRLISMKMKSK